MPPLRGGAAGERQGRTTDDLLTDPGVQRVAATDLELVGGICSDGPGPTGSPSSEPPPARPALLSRPSRAALAVRTPRITQGARLRLSQRQAGCMSRTTRTALPIRPTAWSLGQPPRIGSCGSSPGLARPGSDHNASEGTWHDRLRELAAKPPPDYIRHDHGARGGAKPAAAASQRCGSGAASGVAPAVPGYAIGRVHGMVSSRSLQWPRLRPTRPRTRTVRSSWYSSRSSGSGGAASLAAAPRRAGAPCPSWPAGQSCRSGRHAEARPSHWHPDGAARLGAPRD
jgi:hypothetical protein